MSEAHRKHTTYTNPMAWVAARSPGARFLSNARGGDLFRRANRFDFAVFQSRAFQMRTGERGVVKVCDDLRAAKIRVGEMRISEVGTFAPLRYEHCSSHEATFKIGVVQLTQGQISIIEPGSAELGPVQVNVSPPNPPEVGEREVR